MSSTPRHRRSNIATHIGALVLLVAWPAAAGAEAGAGAEVGIAVQEVLPQLPLPAGPASAGDLSLDARVGRIEGYLPHLATKQDLPHLATKEDLRNTEKSLRAEMKADLQATEARLEKAIDLNREAINKNSEAIKALGTELREQMQNYVLINAGMVTMLGALLLAVMKLMLLPASQETAVRTVMQRQKEEEERQASQAEGGDGGEGGGEEGDSQRP